MCAPLKGREEKEMRYIIFRILLAMRNFVRIVTTLCIIITIGIEIANPLIPYKNLYIILLGVLGFVKYNEYSAKEPVVKVELGDKISEKPEDYVKANKTALKKTVLDLSRGRHGK